MAKNKYTEIDDTSDTTDTRWKDKYLLSLQELKKQELQWQDSEKNLRALIAHLTNAADTSSLKLNKQLSVLRDAINNGVDARKLKKAIDEVADSILGLEALREKSKSDSRKHIVELVEKLKPAGKIESKLAKISDKIFKTSAKKEISPLINELAKILVSGLAQAEKTNKPGLLSFLTAKKNNNEKSIETSDNDEGLVKNTEQEEEQDLSLDYAVKSLIALLEKMALPEDLQLKSNVIKHLLIKKVNKAIFVTALEQTIAITAEILERVRKDKKGIEDFLKQLTGRLHELDMDIRESVKVRGQAREQGVDMSKVMKTEMDNMEEGIRNITDIEVLKTSIQSRVIMLRNRVDNFLLNDNEFEKKAVAIILQLQKKIKKMEEDANHLKNQIVEEREQSLRDALTKIPNRIAYEERLAFEMARYSRTGAPFILVVWDIDLFKNINDTYGHAAGDQVLKLVASILNKGMRETDFIARYGGEEFLSILPNTDLKSAHLLTNKIRETIETTAFHFRDEDVKVTISAGFAEIKSGEGSDALFYRADQALYKAKGNGRNNCQEADGALIIEHE
jgi:diguanylate cyclase